MNVSRINHKNTKYLSFLAMFYNTVLCMAAVLALYFGDIHGFVFTEGAALMPIVYFCGDLITEVYGYQESRKVIWSALVNVIIFMVGIMLLVHIPAAPFWKLQPYYIMMYDRFSRVILCMAIFIPLSEFTNSYILSKLKIMFGGRLLWLRSLTSSVTGEFVIAVLGNFALFAGTYTAKQVGYAIFASFVVKTTFSMVAAYPCVLIASKLKLSEQLDVYDTGVNYNPFKF